MRPYIECDCGYPLSHVCDLGSSEVYQCGHCNAWKALIGVLPRPSAACPSCGYDSPFDEFFTSCENCIYEEAG